MIDKDLMIQLRADINRTLEIVGDRHNVVIRVGRGRYGGVSGTLQLEITARRDDGKVIDVDAVAFRQNARVWGLHPEDLGRTFVTHTGAYRITGAKPRNHKYPILGVSRSGQKFKFTAAGVRDGLVKAAAIKVERSLQQPGSWTGHE